MSYLRVIPRDLFNEANLLKCYGRIYLNLEVENIPGVELEHDGDAFEIAQNPDSGSLTVENVRLRVRGEECELWRPLNARGAWPLYLTTPEGDEIEVFDDQGDFTAEMREFIGAKVAHIV